MRDHSHFIAIRIALAVLLLALLAGESRGGDVYQYSMPVGSRRAYLWIPPTCTHVRGVIMSLSNLLERDWLEDPIVRQAAADEGLGIIWLGPADRTQAGGNVLTADMREGAGDALQKMLDDFADESGYTEIKFAPFISMGHSANGQFSWNVPNCNADRTIAAIPIKTVPLPDSMKFTNVPLCYVVGQTTEWPQFRVPDPTTKPGDRDFFWPVVRDSAIALRSANENNLIGVVTDPGGGHFDWDENQAKFVALYIRKACEYRLPKDAPTNGPVKLNAIDPQSGWLTDTGGMMPDQFEPAPYKQYKGDSKKAYWFFDKETARAAVAFEGDRKPREKQMLTFVQDGKALPVAHSGFAPLKFEPESDGMSFKLQPDFLPEVPMELIGGGTKLGNAAGPISLRVVTGPAIQIGPDTFRVQFNRGNVGGPIWIQEENAGDAQYRRAVQPGQINIAPKLTQGTVQKITFARIDDQKKGVDHIELKGSCDSGLPVSYLVVAGPAEIDGGMLKFVEIPAGGKRPIKVTVVAYQWGRTVEPLYQSAEPVTQTFTIEN